MNAHTITATSARALAEELDRSIQSHFRPSLAIAFCSIKLDLDAVTAVFDDRGIHYIGCTTAGEICGDQVYSDSLSVLLLDLPAKQFRILMADDSLQFMHSKAKQLAEQASTMFNDPALVVLAGGVGVNGDDAVAGFKEVLGEQAALYGGLAGDDLNLQKTQVFSNHGASENGLVALVLDQDHVVVDGLATSGWDVIGTLHTITASEGNVVYSIDEKPALDVFVNYFGYFDNADLKGKPISTISAQYPLQMIREDGSRILRSPLIGNREDGSMVLAGAVEEGAQFQFSISPGFEVIDKVVEEFDAFSAATAQPDALLLFSCVGRHAALGPLISDEVRGIYQAWQQPLAGLFTYGEFGHTRAGKCDFHNETCSLVTLRHKSNTA